MIATYLDTVLRPQLEPMRLSSRQWARVRADILARLTSILANWDDLAFRNAILLPGRELAAGYAPVSVPEDIRALVAVGVRNSIFEDLQTDVPYDPMLRQRRMRLGNAGVKAVTMRAAEWFAAHWAAGERPAALESDLFRELAARFPVAWRRLELLGSMQDFERELDPSDISSASGPVPVRLADNDSGRHVVVLSGHDPRIDPRLEMILADLERNPALFWSVSFKALTRNPEKLLAVLERLLRSRNRFVTANYLIAADHLARRDGLLPPPHDTLARDMEYAANDTGLSLSHWQVMQSVRASLGG